MSNTTFENTSTLYYEVTYWTILTYAITNKKYLKNLAKVQRFSQKSYALDYILCYKVIAL